MKRVEILEKKNKIPYKREYIKNVIKKIMETEKILKYYISIAYLTKDDLRKLNKKFRKVDKTTNVLSFLYDKTPFLIGEVVISDYHVIKKGEDFLKLLIHGILHLIGYDHIKKYDKEKMIDKENYYYNLIKNEK